MYFIISTPVNLQLELHYIRLLSERSDFHSMVMFGLAVTLRGFTCSYAIFLSSVLSPQFWSTQQGAFAVWCQISVFANLKFHCLEVEYIGFMRLHYNHSLRSDSGVIFLSSPERSDFHSASGSVVYRIGAA